MVHIQSIEGPVVSNDLEIADGLLILLPGALPVELVFSELHRAVVFPMKVVKMRIFLFLLLDVLFFDFDVLLWVEFRIELIYPLL